MMEDNERHFIFKHRGETVIVSLNLGNFPEIVKILSADQDTLTALEEVLLANTDESSVLSEPQVWVPQLIEVLQEIERSIQEERKRVIIEEMNQERERKVQAEL